MKQKIIMNIEKKLFKNFLFLKIIKYESAKVDIDKSVKKGPEIKKKGYK